MEKRSVFHDRRVYLSEYFLDVEAALGGCKLIGIGKSLLLDRIWIEAARLTTIFSADRESDRPARQREQAAQIAGNRSRNHFLRNAGIIRRRGSDPGDRSWVAQPFAQNIDGLALAPFEADRIHHR